MPYSIISNIVTTVQALICDIATCSIEGAMPWGGEESQTQSAGGFHPAVYRGWLLRGQSVSRQHGPLLVCHQGGGGAAGHTHWARRGNRLLWCYRYGKELCILTTSLELFSNNHRSNIDVCSNNYAGLSMIVQQTMSGWLLETEITYKKILNIHTGLRWFCHFASVMLLTYIQCNNCRLLWLLFILM